MATTSIASAFRSFTSRSPFRLLTQTPLPQAILRSPVAPSFRVESLTQFRSRSSTSSSFTRPKGRPLTRLTWSKGKSAGRNSAGRITSFHRGGGAKRLRRIVDLKRSTSAEGIVERIEYDPNRSARIALVRWTKGVYPPRQSKCSAIQESVQVVEPITATISSQFSFSSLPGKVNQRKVARASRGRTADSVMIGRPTRMSPRLKSRGNVKTCARDVFLSALYSPKDKGETALRSFGSSLSLPRIAVAGAKPAFFVPGRRDKLGGKNMFSLSEVQKWRSFLPTNRSLFVGAAEHDESKPKTNQGL